MLKLVNLYYFFGIFFCRDTKEGMKENEELESHP